MRTILLALALLLLPGVAHAEWYEASSAHFVVYGDASPERLQKVADNLERFDQAVRLLRGLPNLPVEKAGRVTVYMLASISEVSTVAGNSRIGGLYIPRASGPVAFSPLRGYEAGRRADGVNSQAQLILFHEYSHHLMFSTFANSAFPAWLVEGWAEFHSTATIQADGSVQFGAAPKERANGLMMGNPLPLDRILSADTANLNLTQRDALYGRGWALVHYFTFDPVRRVQFARYVADINAGKSAADAASAFGDLAKLHDELEAFMIRSTLPGITVLAGKITVGPITLRKLTAGEAATMDVRIRSKRGVEGTAATRVYTDAKKAAAPYPNDPAAQTALAEAAYDAGDYAEAEAAADRAIAADPNAIDAHIHKAMARMAVAEKKRDFSPETWRAIRKIIATANRIDPNDPEPLMLYYRSFIEAHQPVPQVAKDGLRRAFELAPYAPELRINLAYMLIKDDKSAEARALLLPLAYNPHGGELATAAKAMVTEIDNKAKAPATVLLPVPAPPPPPPAAPKKGGR